MRSSEIVLAAALTDERDRSLRLRAALVVALAIAAGLAGCASAPASTLQTRVPLTMAGNP